MVINHSKMGEVGRGGGEKWDREGRSRSGGGVEASSGRKADSGSGKSRRTTQIFSRPRPRSLTLRDAAPGWRWRVAFHAGQPCRTNVSEVARPAEVVRGRGLDEQGYIASYRKHKTQLPHTLMNKTEILASERRGADEVECDALKMAVSD